MHGTAVAFVAALALAACRKEAPAASAKPCNANADCPDGWACLAHKCADARHGSAFLNTEQAVTPQKVKAEVDRIQADHEKAVQGAMQRATQPEP